MESLQEMLYDLRSALCNALGYIERCREGDTPSDRMGEFLEKAAKQAKRALYIEESLFRVMSVPDWNPSLPERKIS
ncbi:MAG: hypothetical protein C5B58_15305 [Acidobacteria bacterium]|nr:MAG: hypothetical protein C5B58_15305 [Acidobacteriota bacterium]